MVDTEHDRDDFEEEFDFESDDQRTETGALTETPATPKSKHLPLLLGGAVGIVVLGLVYHFLPKKHLALPETKLSSLASSVTHAEPPHEIKAAHPDHLTEAKLPSSPPPVVTPVKPTTSGVADITNIPAAAATPPSAPAIASEQIQTLQTALERLEHQNQEQQQHVQFLEQGFRQLNAQFNQVNQILSMQNKDLSSIQGMLQNISKELTTLGSEIPKIQTPAPAAETRKETASELERQRFATAPRLNVHAIIPGRAWLKSKDGRIVTVAEGDNLEPYGKVLVIDPKAGVVITNSGVVIR